MALRHASVLPADVDIQVESSLRSRPESLGVAGKVAADGRDAPEHWQSAIDHRTIVEFHISSPSQGIIAGEGGHGDPLERTGMLEHRRVGKGTAFKGQAPRESVGEGTLC